MGDCAAPPEGCNWEGLGCDEFGNFSCGTLVCDGTTPGGTACTGRCAAPPEGCVFEGGGCNSDGVYDCGTIVCGQCEARCDAPPENCERLGVTCGTDGASCGGLACAAVPGGCTGRCASPPDGCHFENAGCFGGVYDCGTLVCGTRDCSGPCPLIPSGCGYSGQTCLAEGGLGCGTITCPSDSGGCTGSCDTPAGCTRLGISCEGGTLSCGELFCPNPTNVTIAEARAHCASNNGVFTSGTTASGGTWVKCAQTDTHKDFLWLL